VKTFYLAPYIENIKWDVSHGEFIIPAISVKLRYYEKAKFFEIQ
jgi:hypothetical protein